jgi:hypothetical protein
MLASPSKLAIDCFQADTKKEARIGRGKRQRPKPHLLMNSILESLFGRRRTFPQDDGYCYLFLHIAKCAGNSLIAPLANSGGWGVHLSEKCNTKAEARKLFREKLRCQLIHPKRLRVVYGHRVFTDLARDIRRPTRFAFFLREPASMIVSLYNYLAMAALNKNHTHHEQERRRMLDARGRVVPFREWLEGVVAPRNLTMTFLYHAVAGDLAPANRDYPFDRLHLEVCKQAVDDAFFVGFTESIDRDGPAFLEHLGIRSAAIDRKNTSAPLFRLADHPEVRRVVEEHNALDCELYRYAIARRGFQTRTSAAA